jgi:hypothetical protein
MSDMDDDEANSSIKFITTLKSVDEIHSFAEELKKYYALFLRPHFEKFKDKQMPFDVTDDQVQFAKYICSEEYLSIFINVINLLHQNAEEIFSTIISKDQETEKCFLELFYKYINDTLSQNGEEGDIVSYNKNLLMFISEIMNRPSSFLEIKKEVNTWK